MLSIMEKILFLKTASVFDGMNSEQLKLISGITTEEDLNPREDLFRQGELGDKMYIIISGEIEILAQSSKREHRIAVLGKSQPVGEFAVLDDEARSAGARAVQNVKVLSVEKEELKELIREFPELAFEFFKVLIRKNRETNRQLLELKKQ
ncbi:MAG: hypothetical protein B6244_01045 [Candidatus Cloacimonetes bacterium 4572_55]|nr:MAG: hypothetical protein B6244_01045 [Candidatus Cloacimonetes bacterium 4572_55]